MAQKKHKRRLLKVSMTMSHEMMERLQVAAIEQNRGVSYLVREIVGEHLNIPPERRHSLGRGTK